MRNAELDPTLPIGIFDSGVGGLTVLRAIRAALPNESTLYLGDTARVPYGTKSRESVVRYSTQASAALVHRGIKLLVVACNTASALALSELRTHWRPLPVIGVVEPGARAAVAASSRRRHLVLATEAHRFAARIQGGNPCDRPAGARRGARLLAARGARGRRLDRRSGRDGRDQCVPCRGNGTSRGRAFRFGGPRLHAFPAAGGRDSRWHRTAAHDHRLGGSHRATRCGTR